MGELTLAAPVAGVTGKGRITADDVQLWRGEVFRDGIVTRAEAESLFALQRPAAINRGWPPCGRGPIIVHQEKRATSLTTTPVADRAISHDGAVDTAAEMELLVRCSGEIVARAPLSLRARTGCARRDRPDRSPVATGARCRRQGEVDLLRRAPLRLRRRRQHRHHQASRTLFRINDSTTRRTIRRGTSCSSRSSPISC